MAIKDILVHLDHHPRSDLRAAAAATLASRHGAHLTGIYVVDVPSIEYFYGATMPFAGSGPEQLVTQIRADAFKAAQPVEDRFRELLRQQGLEGEWRLLEGNVAPTLALHARYADLTVVGQPNHHEARDQADRDAIVVTPLMSSGRPVLVIPFAGDFQVIGDRILVAWNASREATRAVADAMPILTRASGVTVLAVNPRHGIGGHGDIPAADIAHHLARHGVKAEAAHTVADEIPDAEALLSFAADIGADLIVAGGYGHSRAREMVFGGVTRTLLQEMTVPVLLSH